MTPAEALDVGDRLIQLLTQQRLLYRQLQDLARKQHLLVDGKDPEGLLRLLAGRQRLIDRLSAIDRQLEPIRQDWQQVAATLPAQQREEALALVAQVKEILGDIVHRDQEDSGALAHARDDVGHELRLASKGKRVNRAYQQYGNAPRRLFDSRGAS